MARRRRRRTALGLAALLCASAAAAPAAQEPGFEDEITVTGARVPVALGEETRHVEVITGEEIERHAVHSLPELLQLLPGLDVARRGVFGAQADLSVRGSSFEDVLVVVDGVPMNSAQTGHHHLDLPVPVSAIDRVEVLYGPGAALYGANAAGAVVHIRTKPAETGAGRGEVELYGGEHHLGGGRVELAGSARLGARTVSHRLSLERATSRGYRADTDFAQSAAFYRGRTGGFDFFAGASERDFGAFEFYSTRFPNQWEETEGWVTGAGWSGAAGAGTLQVRGSLRRHRDRFVLERSDPSFFTNLHRNEKADVEASYRRETGRLLLEVGGGWVREDLESSNLGDRHRSRGGAFASVLTTGTRWRLHGALHADRVEGSWEVHPHLSASIPAGRGRFRLAAGTAYRLPSFTELYYSDPTSAGSPDLEPEQTTTFEAGYDRVTARSRASLTVFERRGRDLIDFVQAPGETLFVARNLRRVDTRGAELSAGWRLPGLGITASYAWLRATGDEPDGISRYVFDYLRHRAVLRLEGRGEGAFSWGSAVSYNERRGQPAYWRLDARVAYRLATLPLRLYVEGSNLTDETYRETGGVEMPGRWLSCGATWTW